MYFFILILSKCPKHDFIPILNRKSKNFVFLSREAGRELELDAVTVGVSLSSAKQGESKQANVSVFNEKSVSAKNTEKTVKIF